MSWMGWWSHSDGVMRAIFVILLALSVVGWTIILHKSLKFNRLLRQERSMRLALEQKQFVEFSALLIGNIGTFHPQAYWESHMAHAAKEIRVELESGLTFLASIGVSTPFLGLLGTVWGIMHALSGLGHQTSLSMDVVAGPVSEALVATAVGLFAAIPAAIGYNLLIRRLRRLMTMAEGNLLRCLNQ